METENMQEVKEQMEENTTTPKSHDEKSNLIQDEESKLASESSQSSSNLSDISKLAEKPDEVGFGAKKKEKRLYEEIVIPEGLSASIEDDVLIVKKDDKEIKRRLTPLIDIKVEGGKIVMSACRMRRTEKRLFGTFRAHVKNMIKGLTEGFVFKLQIANVHFPMNVSYDKATNELVVKNFLGEKKDRRIKLVSDVDVKVDGENIEVSGYDIEKAGTAATQIEKGVRVRGKDRRVFQDGCFIVMKPGRVYL